MDRRLFLKKGTTAGAGLAASTKVLKMNNRADNTAELADALLDQVIRSLPAIDIHTHIPPAQPAAANLEDIILYHYIVTELGTTGLSREQLERAATVSERIALFLSGFKSISNTVTCWCLRRVLELYGVGEELGIEILHATDEKVRKSASDPDWPRKVLVQKGNIHKTFLTLNITEQMPSFDPQLFVGTLRLDDVVTTVSSPNLRSLESVSGESISDLTLYEQVLGKRLSSFASGGGRALTVGLLPEEDFVPADRQRAERLFAAVRGGQSLNPPEGAALHSSLLAILVGLAGDFHLPVQILLGVRRPLPGGVALPVVRSELVVRYATLFHEFSRVSFDLFLASVPHGQELIAVAKNYRNVSVSGHWWYAFSPPYIRSMLMERLLLLPVVKLHAFFSDAYNVEWSVGKVALLRRELAWVLADLIVSGYLAESQAPEVARCLLYDNPARFYGLCDLH